MLPFLGELALGDVPSADREALGDRQQVRRGVETDRDPVRACHRGRDPGRRGLAVRSRDVDRGIRQLRLVEQRGDLADPVQ